MQVTVRILSVDVDKKQVALTMKTEAEAAAPKPQGRQGGRRVRCNSFFEKCTVEISLGGLRQISCEDWMGLRGGVWGRG